MAQGGSGVHSMGSGSFPKARTINRCIAKSIDLLIAAVVNQTVVPVGFFIGLTYILIADGFAGGRSIGKWVIGLQTVLVSAGPVINFRESIIRNLPVAVAYLAFAVPYVGWIISLAIITFEAVLIVGNKQGWRLGDEVAGTHVLDAS